MKIYQPQQGSIAHDVKSKGHLTTNTQMYNPHASLQHLQRYLGNSYYQKDHPTILKASDHLQRASICGDACANRTAKGEQTRLFQPKLTVGAAYDQYEQEADRVAEQVVSMPEPDFKQSFTSLNSREKFVPADQGLNETTRHFMESRFGRDFSNIRIRTDSYAINRANKLGALAYTENDEIGFASGAYQPDTPFGRRLLAHELAHVVQKIEGRDRHDIPRCSAVISVDKFLVTELPDPIIEVAPPNFLGITFIASTLKIPGIQLDSAISVNCSGKSASDYEVGIIQVLTDEKSEANYYGLTPTDGSLIASKTSIRHPKGPCIDTRDGKFWAGGASGEISLKSPCGKGVALPTFIDKPLDNYKSVLQNPKTSKPNYIRDIKTEMAFTDALAVWTPSGNINILKWLRWNINWEGSFKINNNDSILDKSKTGSMVIYGNDRIRPSEIPTEYSKTSRSCNTISEDQTMGNYIVSAQSSY